MIVSRWTDNVKPGRGVEVVALHKSFWERFPAPHAFHVYRASIGPRRQRDRRGGGVRELGGVRQTLE